MDKVTVSSKGQIAIPKQVRDALNLAEGTKLTLEVRGQEIVLSKGADWKRLQGAGRDIKKEFADFRKEERELEDSRS
ncbi:MAG: AbrB/MazE/SpoVT family DNA-binding domain-containing protein [Candidatus Korobacteraceae bacterium]